MSPLPSRRRFLGAVVGATLAASAGCLDAIDERTDSESDERTLELSLTRRGDRLRDEYVADLGATESARAEAAFEATLAGEAYTTRFREPFLEVRDPAYAERDGTYYRLGSVIVDEIEATRPILRLFATDSDEGGETEPSEAEGTDTIPADDLPEVDARAVHIAHLAARARGNSGGVPWGLVQRGGSVYWNEDRNAESELLGDDAPSHVRYRDRRYAVEISREQFYAPRYRATVDPVAESPERMEAILRAEHVHARFSRADLSSEAQEIVRSARSDGYGEPHPYSDGYEEVLRAMHRRAYIDGDIESDAGVERSGRQLIRYDGVYYDYSLRFRRA